MLLCLKDEGEALIRRFQELLLELLLSALLLNSQDKTAVLMMVVLQFALFVALVHPLAGLEASIPTPATVDFAMKTGRGSHA